MDGKGTIHPSVRPFIHLSTWCLLCARPQTGQLLAPLGSLVGATVPILSARQQRLRGVNDEVQISPRDRIQQNLGEGER